MKIGFIRPPQFLWQTIATEGNNFLMPLNFVALATFLRERGIKDVKIIDCPRLKLGWKSLRKKIEEEKFDVIGVHQITLFVHEAAKLLKMVKEVNPKTITIGGGVHFTAMTEESLENYPFLDFIVRGEGEETLYELIQELMKSHPDFPSIKGIAFRDNGKIIKTEFRPLIENLDSLPFPAYDVLPLDLYRMKGARGAVFGGVTIEHSRGCAYNCRFCSCWPQMGERKLVNGEEQVFPRWRTKSPQRTLEEIKRLYYGYGVRDYVWVDDCWNFDSRWTEEFCNLIIKERLKIGWRAFLRVDLLLRDEKLGILEKMVKAGLSYVMIGIERGDAGELAGLGKAQNPEETRELCTLLKRKYPRVFRMGTLITGIRSETRESFKKVKRYFLSLDIDYVSCHPLTPHPGTPVWKEAKEKGWIEVKDYSQYDWFHPIMPSEHLSREEIFQLNLDLMKQRAARPTWALRGLFSRNQYKKRMYWGILFTAFQIHFEALKKGGNPFRITSDKFQMRKPKWYDS